MTEDEVIEKMARAIFRAQAITTTEWGDADEDIRESCRVYARAESEAAQATLEDEQAAHAETLRLWQEEKARNASARAEGWKAGIEAAAKVARERVAVLEAFARYAAERFAQIECATLNMMITSPEALSDYRVALASEGALRARHALDEGRAPSGVASHKSRQEGEDDGG